VSDRIAPSADRGIVLYGAPHSLYSGIARCYLRTQGIPYTERSTAHPDYVRRILPVTKRGIIPVLQTVDGTIIQDSLDIIDHFERGRVPYPAYPQGALQRTIAVIVQYYGMQAMLRHAMHYRWTYRDQQAAFLIRAFANGGDEARAEKVMARMNSYLPQLGVTAESIPVIEQSYLDLLGLLDIHFRSHPYLLGGRPSIADYGLIGPLFAHLGRDPVPAGIMKVHAPEVFRWVERMTAPDLDVPEFPTYGAEFVPDDHVPETLLPLLRHVADEIFPELTDKLAFIDAHFARVQPKDGDPVSEKPHQRNIGVVDTRFRGVPVQAGVEPYLIYVLRRADRFLGDCGEPDRSRVLAFLKDVGLRDALMGERGYSVDRRQQIEVWEVTDSSAGSG
jgi:glutathione S-transferase